MSRVKNPKKSFDQKQSSFQKELGVYLTQQRQCAGISHVDVASYIDDSVEVVKAYESGERAIPLNRLYALANCLNIPPDEILKKLR